VISPRHRHLVALLQTEYVFLPLSLENFHVDASQDLSQALIASRVLFLMSVEFAVELYQQTALL